MTVLLCISCSFTPDRKDDTSEGDNPELIVKRRDDGSISSINQVVDGRIVHGIRVTYYRDGKTVYSKHSFRYGVKHGPSMWYYKNGQVFKECTFKEGKKQGLTRVYYRSGRLLAEYEFDKGVVMPGLKEYLEDGTLVSSYPRVQFSEKNFLASRNRLDLEISCDKRRSGVKFYILSEEDGITNRVYLITKNDRAVLQYYVKPGGTLDKRVDILAEIPTELGNILAKKYSYHLKISN